MHRVLRTLPRRAILAILPLSLCACSTVDETGRSRIAWMPEGMMQEMAVSAYQQETSAFPEITSGPQFQMVQEVSQRIAEASGQNYDWQFKLLDAPDTVNAFALPGGKIAVYSGLLRVADTPDQLAAVIGHEVAHATARHGNERVTLNMVQSGVLTLASLTAQGWGGMSAVEQEKWLGYAAAAGKYGVELPFSREHESEADEIGLEYMVRAGYDPYAAPQLWEKMAQLGGERPPEFMSTHPNPENRAEKLRELIPTIVDEVRGKRVQRS